jgi:hypothetical protein
MEDTSCHIVLNIKTATGYESYGKFFLGRNTTFAHEVFSKLKGDEAFDETNVLYLDLIEMRKGLPVNLNILSCSIVQLAENIKIITKEVFKAVNLEDM